MAEKPSHRRTVTRKVILIAIAIALFAIGVVLLVLAFVLNNQTGFEGKTLWDWMGLLIVPLILGVGVFLLDSLDKRRQAEIDTRRAETDRKLAEQRAETDRKLAEQRAETDRQLALNRIQEDRLQAYLDRMTDLLLEKGLRASPEDSEIRHVARTRTLTVLRSLDNERQRLLLSFLHDSELLSGTDSILRGAYMSRIDLSRTYLRKANLSGARLRKANLSGADLSEANLSQAVLRKANLSWAHLSEVNLSEANLTLASLSHANLNQANLGGANLGGATYDDATVWPDGFDPVARGAKKVESKPSEEVNADESKPA
jgi:uncharacterized protein YjbI with pentapeptide repeats